jgi:sugar transferase (PEP-CTERM/EpsH1 system associated)
LLHQLRGFADVDLLSLVHDDEEASHADDLKDLASTVRIARVPRTLNTIRSLLYLPSARPTTHTMLDAPGLDATINEIVSAHRPDVVLAYCTGVARLALEPNLAATPLVLDFVDVDSAKWDALALTTTPPRAWVYRREAKRLAEFEQRAARHAVTNLVATGGERATLLGLAPDAAVEVIENGVDAASLRPAEPPGNSSTVVFCGVMNYPPNEEAAAWIAREVWPLVRRRNPDARLQLVGSHPTAVVRGLASTESGIEVTGHVADVRPYLWRGAVAAAPLLTARGVQNKVLEAVAAGLPTVITPVVAQGLPPEVMPACVTADGPAAFADAVVTLLNLSPVERRNRALQADMGALSWDRRLNRLQEIVTRASHP